MSKISIKYIDIDKLVPYKNNPRHNEEAVPYVKTSIEDFGFKVPIVIDKDNEIVAGHTRVLALKELINEGKEIKGIENNEVPCIMADDLTEEQVKTFRLADNKVSEKSLWDLDKLSDELKGMDLANIDLSSLGFSNFEIDSLVNDTTPDSYDNELIEEYDGLAESQLPNRRIIITYEPEQEDEIRKILHIDKDKTLEVKYTLDGILEREKDE